MRSDWGEKKIHERVPMRYPYRGDLFGQEPNTSGFRVPLFPPLGREIMGYGTQEARSLVSRLMGQKAEPSASEA